MRLSILAILLTVFVVLATAPIVFADDWNKDFQVGAKPSLRVETNDGRVHIKAVPGSKISASVQTTGYKISPDDVRITERQTGDSVEIIVKAMHTAHWGVGRWSIDINVTVPATTQLEVKSSDGSLEVLGLRAPARLSTSDGSINVSDYEGPLTTHTSDGSVRVNGRFDDLQMDTADGRIEADVRPGSRMANPWRLHTSDGSIRVRLPQDFSAELDVRTSDGRVSSDLPVTVTGTVRQSSLRGKLNAGGQLLDIKTSDGSIYLQRY